MVKLNYMFHVVGSLGQVSSTHYLNQMDEPFSWNVRKGHAIIGAYSYHNNRKEDRRWYFRYAKIKGVNYFRGHQSLPITHYDVEMYSQCGYGYILTSISSWHNNRKEDRQWHFRCSGVQRSRLDYCHWTHYLNDFDKPLNYRAPKDFVIIGVYSYHNNRHEDRRFMFRICRLRING